MPSFKTSLYIASIALCATQAVNAAQDEAEPSSKVAEKESRLVFQGDDFTINLIPLVVAKVILFGIAYLVSYLFTEDNGDHHHGTGAGYSSPTGYAAPVASTGYAAPSTGYAAAAPSTSYNTRASTGFAAAPAASTGYAAAPAQNFASPTSYSSSSSLNTGYSSPQIYSGYASRKGLDSSMNFVEKSISQISDWLNQES